MKKMICVLLAVFLLAALGASAYADSGVGVEPGQAMPDFTVSLTDGSTATLSALLKEKDLVVLNVFASWCGPCEHEFPDMEAVYKANKDRMVIVSVSGDPDDTMDVISQYKDSHSLTFPMGLAGDALSFLKISGFPTTIFVDKNGNVGFIKVGAFVDPGDFEAKVNTFLSANYDGKPLETEKAVSILPYILGYLVLSSSSEERNSNMELNSGEGPVSSVALESRPQRWQGIGQKLLVLFQMYRFILNAFILSVELFFLFKLSINFIVTLFKIFNIGEGRFGFSIRKTA